MTQFTLLKKAIIMDGALRSAELPTCLQSILNKLYLFRETLVSYRLVTREVTYRTLSGQMFDSFDNGVFNSRENIQTRHKYTTS